VRYANSKQRSERTPHPLPPDQDQRHRQEVGKTISIPVWFVLEGEKPSLLPVRGSDTQWLQEPAPESVDSD
jgi:hypothetical protein